PAEDGALRRLARRRRNADGSRYRRAGRRDAETGDRRGELSPGPLPRGAGTPDQLAAAEPRAGDEGDRERAALRVFPDRRRSAAAGARRRAMGELRAAYRRARNRDSDSEHRL